jgi:hypothetical protein
MLAIFTAAIIKERKRSKLDKVSIKSQGTWTLALRLAGALTEIAGFETGWLFLKGLWPDFFFLVTVGAGTTISVLGAAAARVFEGFATSFAEGLAVARTFFGATPRTAFFGIGQI